MQNIEYFSIVEIYFAPWLKSGAVWNQLNNSYLSALFFMLRQLYKLLPNQYPLKQAINCHLFYFVLLNKS